MVSEALYSYFRESRTDVGLLQLSSLHHVKHDDSSSKDSLLLLHVDLDRVEPPHVDDDAARVDFEPGRPAMGTGLGTERDFTGSSPFYLQIC